MRAWGLFQNNEEAHKLCSGSRIVRAGDWLEVGLGAMRKATPELQ